MGEHEGRLPSAGWLEDPEVPGRQRWWDGQGWTEHRRDPGGDVTATESQPSWAAGGVTAPVTGDLNPLAVASLVASLVWMGGLSSVAAIVLGVLARRQIDESGGRQRGEGLATAGIVLGIVGIVLPLVALVGGLLFLVPFRVG